MHKTYLLSFLWLYVINAVAVIVILICNRLGVESGTLYNLAGSGVIFFGLYMIFSLFGRAFKVTDKSNKQRVLNGHTTRCLSALLFISEVAVEYADIENPAFYKIALWIFAIWGMALIIALATKRLIIPKPETV